VGPGRSLQLIHQPPHQSNDLARFFVERANAGDPEGIVAPFEQDAIMTGLDGHDIAGHDAIRAKYAAVLAGRPQFSLGNQQPAMINGDIALTSTWFHDGGASGSTPAGRAAKKRIRSRLATYDDVPAHPFLGDPAFSSTHKWRQYALPDSQVVTIAACPPREDSTGPGRPGDHRQETA
jgi:uncharacterized protein (TIGR02246 family)